MEFVLQDGDHEEHDGRWTLFSTHYGCPVCLGCITEILENVSPPTIRKKPALAELLRLLTYQSLNILEMFMQEEQVVWHLIHILFEMLKVEEESLLSMAIETILMLVKRTESDGLVSWVLDNISQQVSLEDEGQSLLPHYTLIGKLLYQLPPLSVKLLQEYGELLSHMGISLGSQREEIQSAIAYIFIFVCEGEYERLMPARLHQLVCQGIITMLNTAQNQSVQVNGLGLLKKLVDVEESAHILMSVNIEGQTMMSALKKLFLSKRNVLKIGIAQILSQILKRDTGSEYGSAVIQANLTEFLFEALHTQNILQLEGVLGTLSQLSQMDHFYKRCLAVYGIESIIRAIHTAAELKNPSILSHGFILLNEVLQRQSPDIPLFVSVTVVKECLDVIQLGIGHPQVSITGLAAKTSSAVVRKQYLITPVPFEELCEMLKAVTNRVWQLLKLQKKPKSRTKRPEDHSQEILISYIDLIHKSCRLLQEWKAEPTVWESSFTAPVSRGDNLQQENVINLVLQLCDENCLPLMMIHWDTFNNPDTYQKCMEILCCLSELDSTVSTLLLQKLVEAGSLMTFLDTKVKLCSYPSVQNSIGYFLWLACNLDLRVQGQGHVMLDQDDFQTGVQDINWLLKDAAGAFVNYDLSIHAIQVYVTVLYLSFKYGNRLMLEGDLQCVLSATLEHQTSIGELSPLVKKLYLYLLQYIAVSGGTDMRRSMPNSFQSVVDMICKNSPEVWYSHCTAALQWCFYDDLTATTCGSKVLGAWLSETQLADLEENGNINPCLQSLVHLCHRECFLAAMLVAMATENSINVPKLSFILEMFINCISQSAHSSEVSATEVEVELQGASDEADSGNFLGYLHRKCTEVLQNVFMKNYSASHDHNVAALLEVMRKLMSCSIMLSVDVKILYHVLNLLGEKPPKCLTVQKSGLSLILAAAASHGTSVKENQVIKMLTQSAAVMRFLESCLSQPDILYKESCELVGFLISSVCCTAEVSQPIKLDLHQLSQHAVLGDKEIRKSSVGLLSRLLGSKMASPTVMVTGKITPNEYRTLYIYIQQLVVELALSGGIGNMGAVMCMENMVMYLLKESPKLGEELLSNPWNTTMLQLLTDISTDTGTLQAPTVDVYNLFLKQPKGQEMLKSNPYLLTSITRCVEQQSEHDLSDLKTVLKDLASQAGMSQR